jgi:hypothetical protein
LPIGTIARSPPWYLVEKLNSLLRRKWPSVVRVTENFSARHHPAKQLFLTPFLHNADLQMEAPR